VKPTIEKVKAVTKAKDECPVSKSAFLKHAVPHTFEFVAKPTTFDTGSFGWKFNARPQIKTSKVLGEASVTAFISCNFVVLGSKDKTCGLTEKAFLKAAKPIKKSVTAKAHQFSTGSIGWHAHEKVSQIVAGIPLTCQFNLNGIIKGSKPEAGVEEADLELATVGNRTIQCRECSFW
jgi:hypothetical protein